MSPLCWHVQVNGACPQGSFVGSASLVLPLLAISVWWRMLQRLQPSGVRVVVFTGRSARCQFSVCRDQALLCL